MMMLEIVTLTLGPLMNNVYLLGDREDGDAVVIDPSFDTPAVINKLEEMNWTLCQVWLTHGHFDHIAGAGEIANAYNPPLPVGLHPADREFYEDGGGAGLFGMSIPKPPPPKILFEDDCQLGFRIGEPPVVMVKFSPGHSPGHVMFYCESLNVLFCGDVIFRAGIGRTDLEGGDLGTLLESIHSQVLSLPDDTRLLPGHGPESTVGYERRNNPYL